MAEQPAAELFTRRIAPQGDQFAPIKQKLSFAVDLLQEQLAGRGFLPDRAEEDQEVRVGHCDTRGAPEESMQVYITGYWQIQQAAVGPGKLEGCARSRSGGPRCKAKPRRSDAQEVRREPEAGAEGHRCDATAHRAPYQMSGVSTEQERSATLRSEAPQGRRTGCAE